MKQLFPRLKYYFRWFFINLTGLSATDVQEHTTLEIGSCYWIDCFGHHVLMRRKAFKEIAAYLNAFVCDGLCLYTLEMKNLILSLILEDSDDCAYIYDNDRRDLPIIVYASISPHHATSFITHMLLMLGEYETELDFHLEPTIRDQFVKR